MISQIMLAVTGVTAIWLTQQGNESIKKYACLFGMAGQPFWFYSAYTAEQWGIFVLCLFYTYSWGTGIYNNWIKLSMDIESRKKRLSEYDLTK